MTKHIAYTQSDNCVSTDASSQQLLRIVVYSVVFDVVPRQKFCRNQVCLCQLVSFHHGVMRDVYLDVVGLSTVLTAETVLELRQYLALIQMSSDLRTDDVFDLLR